MRRHGAVTVARTPGRMAETLYGVAMAQDFDIPVEILTPAEFGELWPAAVTEDLVGAVNFPTDGTVNPGDAALSLAKGAKDRGARFVQGATVTGFTARLPTASGSPAWRPTEARSRPRPSCWRRGCGRASSLASPVPAWRCTRPSTCGS